MTDSTDATPGSTREPAQSSLCSMYSQEVIFFVFPQTNPQGTQPEQLIQNWKDWLDFLREARKAADKARPRSRDYSPQRYPRAAMQHDNWCRRINSVIYEIEALVNRFAESIDSQDTDCPD